jgi:FtsP/CotA-like multicopper oxidase with cupredoxin domain
MMRHPMHLHGHDFRVLNGQGEYAPFKNVLDIMPMETDTIELMQMSKEIGFFIVIFYHMMAGMNRVFSY